MICHHWTSIFLGIYSQGQRQKQAEYLHIPEVVATIDKVTDLHIYGDVTDVTAVVGHEHNEHVVADTQHSMTAENCVSLFTQLDHCVNIIADSDMSDS